MHWMNWWLRSETGLTNAEIEEEIARNQGMLWGAVFSYSKRNPGIDEEDLYQAALMGVMGAGRRFKRWLGLKFMTYALHYVDMQLRNASRRHRQAGLSGIPKDIVFDENLKDRVIERLHGRLPHRRFSSMWDDERQEWTTTVFDDEEGIYWDRLDTESVRLWGYVDRFLPSREAAIIRMRCNGSTLDEVASLYKMSRERVRQIMQNSIRRLSKQEEFMEFAASLE
jgi:RNA polymerase sigma factor (sigma-70 family)